MFTLVHLTQRRSCTLRPFPFSPHLKCCCFVFVLQMEVVSTFKRSGSFQGAVRRRSSVLSQLHDVNTISTPSHVALSTATANTSPAPGSESANTHVHTHSHQTSICQQLSASHPLSFLHIQLHTQSHTGYSLTLLHGTWTAVILMTLYGCVSPLARLLLVCVCKRLLCFLFFFLLLIVPLLLNSTQPSWPG